jgi:hypothetical protein
MSFMTMILFWSGVFVLAEVSVVFEFSIGTSPYIEEINLNDYHSN